MLKRIGISENWSLGKPINVIFRNCKFKIRSYNYAVIIPTYFLTTVVLRIPSLANSVILRYKFRRLTLILVNRWWSSVLFCKIDICPLLSIIGMRDIIRTEQTNSSIK